VAEEADNLAIAGVCPRCGYAKRKVDSICSVCQTEERWHKFQAASQQGGSRECPPGFWNDGSFHFGLILFMILVSPGVGLLTLIATRSLPGALAASACFGVVALFMSVRGSTKNLSFRFWAGVMILLLVLAAAFIALVALVLSSFFGRQGL
jgi:hypothetical protein